MKTYNVAVVGATGTVGETLLEILAERKFPVKNLYALASTRSAGAQRYFREEPIQVQALEGFDFKKADIALFSAGGSVSAKYVPLATRAGCVVIDNTSHFRYDDDVPLVVTEVNPEDLAGYKKRLIIANPNCSTMQMLVVLKPLYDAVGIKRINVATYQSVSGAGKKAIQELAEQSTQVLAGEIITPKILPSQIAFNVVPHIDVFLENGYTKEEMKIVWETHKILGDNTIEVNATAVRVPVFYGHSEAVHIETRKKITAVQARSLLSKSPGVVVIDEQNPGGYPMAIHAAGRDPVYVGRIREDISHPQGLNLWVVSDNIRKGAALNTVQIAELMIERYLM